MPNPRALVLFASTHGHTARIATHLADRLGTRDLDVDLYPAIDVDLTDWAAVDAFTDRIAAVGATLAGATA